MFERRLSAAGLIALLLGSPHPARADQNDPALPGLFRSLASASSERAARAFEQDIRTRWAAFRPGAPMLVRTQAVEARRLVESGQTVRAGLAYAAIAKAEPTHADSWAQAGILAEAMREDVPARAWLDGAIRLEPRHFPALAVRALLRQRQGDLQGALADIRAARQLNPHLSGAEGIESDILGQIVRQSVTAPRGANPPSPSSPIVR